MSILQRIRLVAAIVLVFAIFLPLSECSRRDDKNFVPPQKTFSQQLFPQSNSDFEYTYVISFVIANIRASCWQAPGVSLIALLWPLLAFLFDKKIAGKRFGWTIYIFELLLCWGTLYWLTLFTALGRLLYGAYVVVIAIIGFGLATVVLLVMDIRKFLRERCALKSAGLSA